MSHLNRTQSLAQLGLSVSRIKVEDLDEQRLDQLRVDLQKELNVRLVEAVQVLQPADQIQVGTSGVTTYGCKKEGKLPDVLTA